MIALIIIGIIVILMLLPTLAMLCWKCYIHIIHKKRPFGTDKTMTDWPMAVPVFNGFQFKNDNSWPQFYHQFKLNVVELLNQHNSPLTIYFDKQQQSYAFQKELSLADVFTEYDTIAECQLHHCTSSLSVKINCCPQKAWITIAWDHVSFDGTRVYNEVLAPLFALKIYEPDPYFSRYTPFYTEGRMALLAWHYRRIGLAKPYQTFENFSQQFVLLFEIPSIVLKKLKNKYNCSLSEMILAMYCYQLFSISKPNKKQLTFGMLIACDSNRFRNNYSIMCLEVKRSKHIKHLVAQIKKQRHQKSTIQAMYQLLTFSRVQTYLKENILDCLISPFFFQAKRSFSSQINNFEFMNLPTSLPLYSLYISYKSTIHISLTVNTPDLDFKKLKHKPFKTISFTDLYATP